MTSQALVRRESDRLVRSYHPAFVHELTLYGLGDDVRFWWPIPARAICWFAGIAALFFVVAHQLGFGFSVLMGLVYYLVIPILLAWLLSAAQPEGRRLHVVVGSWAKYAVRGHRLVGGYQAISGADVGHYGPTKIKVTETYVRREFPVRSVVIGLGIVALLAVVTTVARSVLLTNSVPSKTPTAVVARPHVATVRARPALRVPPPAPRRSATSVAHQFAIAYLSYQVGQNSPQVQDQFRTTCTPQFAALLSGSPIGGSYQPFHVDTIRYEPPQLVVIRFSNRRHQHGTLHVHVTDGGGWKVAGLS